MAVSGNNNNKEKEIKTKEKEAKIKNSKVKAFFRGVCSELQKVHWPTKKQLVTYTGVVIVAVLVMAIAISVFDWAISSVIELLLSLA